MKTTKGFACSVAEIHQLKKQIKRNKPDLHLSMWLRLKRAIRKFRGKM